MALLVSFDDAAKLLARQAYGIINPETTGLAEDALELALQEVELETHLITQEGEATLSLTGANDYDLSDVSDDILRVVKAWTGYGSLDVIRKAEFVTRYPDFESYGTGIPSHLVLWGNNNLYVWPDQSGQTLNVIYYKLMAREMGASIMSKLIDIARKFAESAPETRGVNRILAREALETLNKGQTRSSDLPLRFRPDEKVTTVNRFKRMRRR